ncbi:MAG: GTPase Era [Alphaproteobacteria bacterium]
MITSNSAATGAATKAGFIALVGQTNAGKSTLMNALIGQKLAIVTPKAQTTRMPIRGIATTDDTQYIFVDTPGLHNPKRLLDETMLESAHQSWRDADAVLMLVDARKGFQKLDADLIDLLRTSKKPVFLALNKIDVVKDKEGLLPILEQAQAFEVFREVFPLSALKATDNKEKIIPALLTSLRDSLPDSPFLYDVGTVTDQSLTVRLGEITREKAFMHLQQELPYGLAVQMVSMTDFDNGSLRVEQNIILGREAHKPMVIGAKGAMLKKIGTAARKDMKDVLGRHVHLFLNVKVKEGWDENRRQLAEYGILNAL